MARVAVAGDWHGNGQWACQVVKAVAADGVSKIYQLGDFGVWPGREGRRYLDEVDAACAEFGVEIEFVDGNHEDHPQLLAKKKDERGRGIVRPRIHYLPRGYRWEVDGRTWLAVGGAASIDKAMRSEGRDWWPEEELTDAQAAAIVAGGKADVILSHDYPASVVHSFGPLPRGWAEADRVRNEVHSQRIQKVVEGVQATYVFHGHIHRAYYRWVGSMQVVGLDLDGSALNWIYLDTETMEWERS